jgi:hypothetical protein
VEYTKKAQVTSPIRAGLSIVATTVILYDTHLTTNPDIGAEDTICYGAYSNVIWLSGEVSTVIMGQLRFIIAGLAKPVEAISLENPIVPILNGLPAQERIGRVINDVPDIGGVALAKTADPDYVPACA